MIRRTIQGSSRTVSDEPSRMDLRQDGPKNVKPGTVAKSGWSYSRAQRLGLLPHGGKSVVGLF